jgi:hypothetical protein
MIYFFYFCHNIHFKKLFDCWYHLILVSLTKEEKTCHVLGGRKKKKHSVGVEYNQNRSFLYSSHSVKSFLGLAHKYATPHKAIFRCLGILQTHFYMQKHYWAHELSLVRGVSYCNPEISPCRYIPKSFSARKKKRQNEFSSTTNNTCLRVLKHNCPYASNSKSMMLQ